MRIHLHIAKIMPSLAREYTTQIGGAIRELKQDRDTWRAVAHEYKAAFASQSARLRELQDICFATQAELENERGHYHRTPVSSLGSQKSSTSTEDSTRNEQTENLYGTATIFSPDKRNVELQQQSAGNSCFQQVQEYISQRNYGSALAGIDLLLRGSLPMTTRLEGLLLKSSILRAANPEELYNALAACSEALALCDHLSDLESFVSRIRYQQGLCYYELRMLDQARDAFAAVSKTESLYTKASEYRLSCDEELEASRHPDRRSGFEEHRMVAEGLLAQLEHDGLDKKRHRSSTQVRLRALSKTRHLSLPHRWAAGRSASHGNGN